jgi:hypothetical protein
VPAVVYADDERLRVAHREVGGRCHGASAGPTVRASRHKAAWLLAPGPAHVPSLERRASSSGARANSGARGWPNFRASRGR